MNRSIQVKRNIYIAAVLKITGMGLSYFAIPITIKYLGNEKYGIWVTLLSIISWFGMMDIGLGNGFRNKLSEAISKKDFKLAKEYMSTAYGTITIISLLMLFVFIVLIPILNWNTMFNTNVISGNELKFLILIYSIFFSFNFLLSLYNQVLYALQKSALTGVSQLINNVVVIALLSLVINRTDGNIVIVGLIYGVSSLFTSILMTVWVLLKNKELIPEIRFFKKIHIKTILNLGIKFFVMQIAVVVIFSSTNILITQLFGPEQVTQYNIVQKLFMIVGVGTALIMSPLWSAFTEAFVVKDIIWIRKVIRKLEILMIPIIILIICLSIFAKPILTIWIGKGVVIDKTLIFAMAIYTLITIWNNIYAFFLNGIGFINISMFATIFIAIINIPLSIVFVKYLHFGLSGIIISNSLCLLVGSIQGPIQTYYILRNYNNIEKIKKIWK